MQRLKRVPRWWLALALVVVVAGGSGGVLWARRGAAQAGSLSQVFTVARGNLVASISPTGEVYASRQAELSFDVNKIALIELKVAPGQQVKAGDVLARIDSTTLERAVTQAEADLTVAQDNLEEAQNPYTELDLAQARLAVAQNKTALATARESLKKAQDPYTELEMIQAGLAVTQAQTALVEAKDALDTLLHPDLTSAQATVRDAEVALRSAQTQLVVAQNDPDNAERLRTLEYEATWYRNNYWEAQDKFNKGKIDQQKLDWEYSNMLAAEEKLRAAQAKAENALASAQNQVPKTQEAYQEALDSLAKLRNPDAADLTKARNEVAQAEYNLAKAQDTWAEMKAGPAASDLAKAQDQVAQAEYNLAKAQDDLAKIEAGPDPKEIEVAQAKVVSAQATLEEAQAVLEAATMAAPFDGTVISIGAEVGDLVSSGTTIITLADLTNLRVRATVDETDISQVEVGQDVEITFDAFPGQRFQGQVLEVPLQGELSQNILTYKVPVSLEGATGVSLKPGMTANLSIGVGRRQNVLLVPVMAVQQGDAGNVVEVQDSPRGPISETPVTLGLSNGMYVEVTRGLNEGDRVVYEYQASQESQGVFRSGGPGFMIQMERRP